MSLDWSDLLDEGALADLLSEEYARFAGPVCEALAVFLGGLPDAAQRDVLAAQAALPGGTDAAQRLGAVAQQCPVLHKLGQTLARDRRLDSTLRRELCKLEAMPPTVPVDTLRGVLDEELGSLEGHGIRLDPAPVGQASVAVVVGYEDGERRGVFKILKPGIRERLELELELLARVGLHLDERCAELGIPKLRYEDAFRQIERKLRDEVHLDVEQRNLALAARHYAPLTSVQVPALYEHCTPRVTAMERVTGRKITEHGLVSAHARERLAAILATALLARPVLSTRDDALFHGDPHAGNLLLTREGRVAMLDWSLAGTLRHEEREAIVHLLLSAMMLDEQRVCESLATFDERRKPGPGALANVVGRHLQRLRQGRLPSLDWFVSLMDDAVERAGMRARADLMLFRKSLHVLDGLMTELETVWRPTDRAIAFEFVRQLATEWPRRWLSAPDSRDFSSRLSNADLARLMLGVYPAVGRFWTQRTLEAFSDVPPHGAAGACKGF